MKMTAHKYRVLLGAVAHYYSNPQHVGKDESVWQLGPRAVDGTRLDGIAQMMIEALREIAVLDSLTQLDSGSNRALSRRTSNAHPTASNQDRGRMVQLLAFHSGVSWTTRSRTDAGGQ